MTYCLGIKLKEGLVALADTRITAGTDTSSKKKVYLAKKGGHSLFIMTSGLRSVRDKAVHYFEELIEEGMVYNKMYKAVNAFGEQIKRVALEDKKTLERSGFRFNLNAIVGGQLEDDADHKLFLLYSEGNWVELDEGAPYVIIGNSGQGKAILNRVIDEDSTMKQALKAAFLSFDSTRVSNNDVDFPIDVVLYKKNSFQVVEHRYHREDLQQVSGIWADKLKDALNDIPEEWMDSSFDKMPKD
ncbi:putative proteasome-type protease [Dyadobacter jejuensis]|uniref:Putative proteasome-type protease n=1 Tax=Dyadobacter jejuensis TaxID=1082580 RepID=A0A316APV3_9BACT|nr:peptidase [Dyadobacter jejuensis]PWJ58860.1 putative proteasome-type protease [Dyadobacter jejuensis]